MLAAAALAAYAIVAQDQASLRAAPRDAAAKQAVLWQGDLLEVRGARMDYLQVYDHRRERAGWVLASQVRPTSATPAEAPELLSVLRFLRDDRGAEGLGIAYAAAYLKAVPADAMTAEPFDALGTLADRLARLASTKQTPNDSAAIAAHLDVAAAYGVTMRSYEHDGAMRVCYDGEAFRHVLAMADATPGQRARAALGLTRHDCVDPDLSPTARFDLDQWRAGVLDRMPTTDLPATLKNRLRLRRAGVWAALAFEQTRHADATAASRAAQRAIDELAAVDKAELSDDDQAEYTQAAIRTGASRWAAEPLVDAPSRVKLQTVPGQPGETCVLLTDAQHDATKPLLRRCTWGTVWTASASVSPDARAVALAVQPLAGWRELWVLRRGADGWSADVLPPALGTPAGDDLGYAEFAGWMPGNDRLLVVREARVEGRYERSFEIVRRADLLTDRRAPSPGQLAAFAKWQDVGWKRATVSVR